MFGFIVGLILFVCFLLVVVILAQNAKGGGLSSQFGGSGASNIIGVKKTGDLLERLTWGFTITIMVLALLLTTNFVAPSASGSNDILDKASEQAAPASTLPLPESTDDSTESEE
ncbi:MAG: preprotein translocase subunit SecG [Cyclobacteriaceae bacterium]|nr:preprotein translocase subunit SecG [Cyclobacteriaceae bacterium]